MQCEERTTLTNNGPEEEAELFESIPCMSPRMVRVRRSFLQCPHASPTTIFPIFSCGAAEFRIVHVVTIELVIDIDIHTVGRPRNTALTRIERNLTCAVGELVQTKEGGK